MRCYENEISIRLADFTAALQQYVNGKCFCECIQMLCLLNMQTALAGPKTANPHGVICRNVESKGHQAQQSHVLTSAAISM